MSSYTGDRIRQLRKEKGLTQKQLGDLCGMADSAIRRYESGRQNPKIETLKKIASALEAPIELFIAGKIHLPILPDCHKDEYKKIRSAEEKELYFINKMDKFYELLNDNGQDKAIEQVELLTKIPEYRKDTE